MLSRGRCFPAASRIRPLVRAFCDVPPSLQDAAAGVPSSQDHTEKVDDVKARPDELDIAIVGGGMVGLAVASNMPLTKHLRVGIIDSNPALKSRNYLKKDGVPDSRVSTITPATISFFRDIGAWDHVQQQRLAFFGKMQVWDYTGLGYTRYSARDVGKEYLGCVVENKVLCNSLLLRLQEENGDIEKMIYPTRLISLALPSKSRQAPTREAISSGYPPEELNRSNLVKLELSDGQTLYSKLVVGADGSKSNVRQTAGIKTTGWNYPQSAIICTVEHSTENDCAWQRFLPSGPIALLPIGDNYSNIVWTMSPEESLRHKSMSPEDFVKSVNNALDFGYGPHPHSGSLDYYMEKLFSDIGSTAASTKECFEVPPKAIGVVSERMAFPLSLKHSHDYISKRLALVGDAAHTVHPLAGQGVNLGFGDAAALAKVIAEGVSVGADFGDISLLKRYENDRKAANVAMAALLDGFQKMYSVDFGPLNVLRAAAFHGAQYISPLKKNIISYAMGDAKWPLFLGGGGVEMSNRIEAVAAESNSTSCPPKFLFSCRRRLGKKPRTPRPLEGGKGKGMSSSSASAVPPEDDVCSVCHDRFRIPCQANCSHWFCGECIIRVWNHGPAVQPCKCPICRRLINLLVPANVSIDNDDDPQIQHVLGEVQHYNRIFGGTPRNLTQRLQDLPFFIRRLFRELLDPQRTLPLVFRARMVMMVALSAIYVLSPVDILPENVLGLFGFFDDFLVLLIVFLHLAAVYRSLLLYRHGGH
uniref:Ubiquinone biosynthesis monooxygenase COQ6, mitochondrial n=2 Tax=Oryza rufipogon TaxID=4529 RepID=A0A0E0P3N7_ORYRU